MIISALKFNIDENLVLRSSWLKLGFLGHPHSHVILGVLLNLLLWKCPLLEKTLNPLYEFARAAIAKYRSPGGLESRKLFSYSSGAWSPRSSCSRFGFLWSFSHWLVDGCLPLCLHVDWPVVCICAPVLSSCEDISHMGWRPTHMTSLTLSMSYSKVSPPPNTVSSWDTSGEEETQGKGKKQLAYHNSHQNFPLSVLTNLK